MIAKLLTELIILKNRIPQLNKTSVILALTTDLLSDRKIKSSVNRDSLASISISLLVVFCTLPKNRPPHHHHSWIYSLSGLCCPGGKSLLVLILPPLHPAYVARVVAFLQHPWTLPPFFSAGSHQLTSTTHAVHIQPKVEHPCSQDPQADGGHKILYQRGLKLVVCYEFEAAVAPGKHLSKDGS